VLGTPVAVARAYVDALAALQGPIASPAQPLNGHVVRRYCL
jgi:hypothetical protein